MTPLSFLSLYFNNLYAFILQITFKQALTDFFANVTWSDPYNEMLTVDEQRIIARWDNPSIWVSLPVYMIFVVSEWYYEKVKHVE